MHLDRKTVVNMLLFSGNRSVGAGLHVISLYLCSGKEHKRIWFFYCYAGSTQTHSFWVLESQTFFLTEEY